MDSLTLPLAIAVVGLVWLEFDRAIDRFFDGARANIRAKSVLWAAAREDEEAMRVAAEYERRAAEASGVLVKMFDDALEQARVRQEACACDICKANREKRKGN